MAWFDLLLAVCGLPTLAAATYLAALAAEKGHEVRWTSGPLADGDVALVLSSLVDYRNETAWADDMRRNGVTVGFVGLAASHIAVQSCERVLSIP